MAVLTSLSLFGEVHSIQVALDRGKKWLDILNKSLFRSKYTANKVPYLSKAKFFDEVRERTASTKSRLS